MLSARAVLEVQNQKTRLSSLDLRTFPDFFWAMKSGKMSIGARVALAMDSSSDSATSITEPILSESGALIAEPTKLAEEMATKAMSIDFLVDATMK